MKTLYWPNRYYTPIAAIFFSELISATYDQKKNKKIKIVKKKKINSFSQKNKFFFNLIFCVLELGQGFLFALLSFGQRHANCAKQKEAP